MKAKINHLLMFLLGFLGVSCDKVVNGILGDMMAEYGCPNAEFSIKGRVTDEDGNPVKGIKVTPVESWGDNKPYGMEYCKTETGEDGNYSVSFSYFPLSSEGQGQYKVAFDDIDGEENGGRFRSDTLSLDFKQVEPASGNWFKGGFEAQADVALTMEVSVADESESHTEEETGAEE